MLKLLLLFSSLLFSIQYLKAQAKVGTQLYPVLNGLKLGFIDAAGKQIVDFKYEVKQREEIQQMREGLIPYRKNKKWGFLNAKGNEIIPADYDIVSGFNNGYCLVGKLKLGQTNPKYGSVFGVINNTGIEVVPIKYEEAQFSMHPKNKYFTYKAGRKIGFVHIPSGKDVINNFSEILPFYEVANNIDQAPAKDAVTKKWGLINGQGEWLFDPKFEYVDHIGLVGTYQITGPDGQWALAQDDGSSASEIVDYNRVSTNEFAKFSNGRLVIKDDYKKYGFLDDTLGLIIPCKYTIASSFYGNIAITNEGGLTKSIGGFNTTTGGKWSLINKDGDIVAKLANLEEFRDFSEGLAAVKIGGLWGFLNEKGAVSIKPTFKEVPEPFINGLSLVSNLPTYSNKFGYINKEGKVIKPLDK